ncbi:MAG: hypothetical protein AAGG44_12200, partial [Planctomycetota bacterium]
MSIRHIAGLTQIISVALLTTATSAADSEWERIEIFPPEIRLSGAADFQSVVAVAVRSDGITRDITEEVSWSLTSENATNSVPDGKRQDASPAGFAKLDAFRIMPVADGKGQLRASWQEFDASVDVSVAGSQTPKATSFHLDVMPVLTRSGCNTGSCHG